MLVPLTLICTDVCHPSPMAPHLPSSREGAITGARFGRRTKDLRSTVPPEVAFGENCDKEPKRCGWISLQLGRENGGKGAAMAACRPEAERAPPFKPFLGSLGYSLHLWSWPGCLLLGFSRISSCLFPSLTMDAQRRKQLSPPIAADRRREIDQSASGKAEAEAEAAESPLRRSAKHQTVLMHRT